nr:MAG TPA: Regulatory protein-modification, helix-turn-helix, transcriptional regulato, DNA [Caudoviricetes sp.]
MSSLTNTALLKAAIQKSGLKYKYLAEQLGLSTYGLQKKVENATEFKASEILALSKLLRFDDATLKAIFFAK